MASIEEIATYFPDVDPCLKPVGGRVLVQIQKVPEVTKGGVWRPQQALDADQGVMDVAKVIAVGDMAFRDKDTGKPRPGAPWYEPGQLVIIPRHGGLRRQHKGIPFALFFDDDILGVVTDVDAVG